MKMIDELEYGIIINHAMDLAWELDGEWPLDERDYVVRCSYWAYETTKSVVVSPRIGGIMVAHVSKFYNDEGTNLSYPFTVGTFVEAVLKEAGR
jgi:hypothetical protein